MNTLLRFLGALRRLVTRAGTALALGLGLGLAAHSNPATAATLGHTVLPAQGEDEQITVFYPSSSPAGPLREGFVTLLAAPDGTPVRGNGRLVLVSHGTGGGVPVHTDLARALVEAGFVVAMPLHKGDNWRDHDVGTFESPKRRPQEISRAIDALARDARFAPLLQFDKVGVYGMSAGGFTALTLAGGEWSPQRFIHHCDVNLAQDFQFCTGVITQLNGGWLDGLKQWVARLEIRRRFGGDLATYRHTDPRVAAVLAAVPAAAAFDMSTLSRPKVPLGLVTMGQDRWLIPAFHAEAVLSACKSCERVAHLDQGGHGVMLAPLPPGLGGVLGEMLNDPPGFDRGLLPAIDQRIAAFFVRKLVN